MPSVVKSVAPGSRIHTFVGGTGPNGATMAGGPVLEPLSEKLPITTAQNLNGKVLLKGNVIKSAVSHDLNNTSTLTFKGKVSSSNTESQSAAPKRSKDGENEELGDVTVDGEVKMSIVTHTMTTNGICFESDD